MKHNILVILDANAIIPHFELRAPALRALLDRCNVAQCGVAVPEVVVREVIAKRTSMLAEVMKTLESPVNRELGLPTATASPGLEAKDFENAFRSRLESERIQVLDLPKTHDETIARAIAKVPPFNDGAKGYRDALVWEAVLQAALEDDEARIILVSADEGFGPPAVVQGKQAKTGTATTSPANVAHLAIESTLPWHPTLAAELEEINAESRVFRVRSPHAALARVPSSPPPPEQPLDTEVSALVANSADQFWGSVTIEELSVGGVQVTELHVEVYDEPKVKDISFEAASDDTALSYTVQVTLPCTLLGFAHKWEAMASSRPRLRVTDPDWNEWVAEVSLEAEVDLELLVVLGHEDGVWVVREVEVVEVGDVHLPGADHEED